jgi:hypothetical protein
MWQKLIAAAGQVLAAVLAALVDRLEARADQRRLGAAEAATRTTEAIGDMSDEVRAADHAAHDGARGVRDRLRADLTVGADRHDD